MTRDSIPGVIVRDPAPHSDERGSFVETFRQSWLPSVAPPMIQSNLSRSRAGVLRGMHFHLRQSDWWVVLEGSAMVVLFDLRGFLGPGWQKIAVTASAGLTGIYIPPGVAHGFLARSDMTLQYLVDADYDGSDELGFAWDDPEAAIGWSTSDPVLSDRDRASPALAE